MGAADGCQAAGQEGRAGAGQGGAGVVRRGLGTGKVLQALRGLSSRGCAHKQAWHFCM
jgi:hypothetical protein